MQCSCGGETVDRKNVCKELSLEYRQCTSCIRQGFYVLKGYGSVEVKGDDAKRIFNDIKENGTPNAELI